MKKIIALVTLTIGIGFTAKAQELNKAVATESVSLESKTDKKNDNNVSQEKLIYSSIDELNKLVSLDESLKKDLTSLLLMRKDAVENSMSDDEKKANFQRYTNKFLGGLNPKQLDKLKTNTALFNKLTQYPTK